MNRTHLSLTAVGTALAAVTGFAALTAPDDGPGAAQAAARLPVERSSLLCPAPSSSDLAETAYTSFTPKTPTEVEDGTAALQPATRALKDDGKKKDDAGEKKTKPFLALKEQGRPVTADASGAESPALVGSADGRLAPGWSAQATTTVAAGAGRGLLGVNCSAPDTSFWFPGASTAKERTDYIHVTNPDDSAAVVDIELYGKDGRLKSEVGEGIQVRPHSSVPVLLSTLTDKPQANLTAHVTARSGRVAAAVESLDDKIGGDWLAPSADPSGSLVLPGIPKDATDVRLIAFARGADDADLKLSLAGPNSAITPAGHETLHIKSGMTAAVDLGDVTRGEPGSLLLTPTEPGDTAPVVAALRVTRGKGSAKETAFIPATAPVGERSTVPDNRAKGSTLSLVAPGKAAKVRVTASAGSEGGSKTTKTYTVEAGRTLEIDRPPVPDGLKGTYALTVESVSGGPVHASRTLAPGGDDADGVPMFTVQTLSDDRGLVQVPEAQQDLTVLQQ